MPADSISRMDSNGAASGASEGILGSSPGAASLRERTDSESSEKSTRFVLPSMDGSPPKVLTLDEVVHVVKNIQNMELAHEIALNPDFKLQPYEPPENSLERRIKDMMHKAFWDLLREDLEKTPPCYNRAMQLLAEIKDCFPQILTQTNQRLLDHINEVLDLTVIKQQAENKVLDFKTYANFIIQIMAKSCAPARDEAVKKLTEIEDVVDAFRGILEVMTLMKLDMANYTLDLARSNVMANSVEYEKMKFKEHLEYYKFGFPATENWLKRNQPQNCDNRTVHQTITNAYMELMDWDESHEFPEVLSIDKERIFRLSQRAKRLSVLASLISVASAIPVISQRSSNREELAKEMAIILKDATNEKEISETIENIWEHIKTKVNKYLNQENQAAMDENTESVLKTQIVQASKKESPVRQLMWKRLQTYFYLAMRSSNGLPPPPPGYIDYQDELESYATALERVIGYNHAVFGDYFKQLMTQPSKQRTERSDSEATTSKSAAAAASNSDAEKQSQDQE